MKPGVRPEAFQELLWFDPSVTPEPPDDLPLSRYFPDLGLVVGRTSWADDAAMVSFKAAPGGGHKAWRSSHETARESGWSTLNAGHHHPDAGTFVLLGHGSYLAIDEGYSNQKKHEHHNGVLVDGQGFVNEGRYHVYKDLPEHHVARIRSTLTGAGWTCATSESAAMYADHLGVRRVDRHLAMSPRGTVVLVDHFESDVPRSWTWLLQSDNPFDIEPGCATTDAGSGRLRVSGPVPDDASWDSGPTVVHANPTASSPELAIEQKQHTLRRTCEPTTEMVFVSVLEPLAWDDHAEAEVAVRHEGTRVTVELDRAGVRERVEVDLRGAGTATRAGSSDEPDAADGTFAVWSRSASLGEG